MASQYTYDAGMRYGVNWGGGIGTTNGIEPGNHPRGELRDALAAMLARVFKICCPGIEHRPIEAVPALPFPSAEIEFLQTWIGLNGTERFGKQAASA